jgi:hypothetical protein
MTRDVCIVASITANPEEYDDSLSDEIHTAIESLRQSVDDTTITPVVFWGFNSVALHASKCALLLTKVSGQSTKNKIRG